MRRSAGARTGASARSSTAAELAPRYPRWDDFQAHPCASSTPAAASPTRGSATCWDERDEDASTSSTPSFEYDAEDPEGYHARHGSLRAEDRRRRRSARRSTSCRPARRCARTTTSPTRSGCSSSQGQLDASATRGRGRARAGRRDGVPDRPRGRAQDDQRTATETVRLMMSRPRTSPAYTSIPTRTRSGSGPGAARTHVLGSRLRRERSTTTTAETVPRGTSCPRRGRSARCRRSRRRATRCTTSKRSHSSPALAWRNHTRSPTRSAAAALPSSGVWTSPAPSRASSFRPAGRTRARQPVAPRGAGRRVAAAERGRDLRRRLAHDRQREQRRRRAA